MKSLLYLLFTFLTLTAISCGDRVTGTAELPDPAQINYFPLKIGRISEYRLDSIVFDFSPAGGTVRDTIRLLVREVTIDTFRDNSGELVYRIERYERPADLSGPWTLQHIFTESLPPGMAIRTEGNLRFIRLVFPLDRATRWDGNRFFDAFQEVEIAGELLRPFAGWRYDVDSLDLSGVVGPFAFDSLLYITEVDETNSVQRRLSRAVYAKNVGLVRREQWILDSQYCNTNPLPADCETRPWELKGERGYILFQEITDYQ